MNIRTLSIPVILFISLFVCTSTAFADEWRFLYDFGNRKVYLRSPTAQYLGKPITVRLLVAFKETQDAGKQSSWRSWVQTDEYDCGAHTVKTVEINYYAEDMGIGEPVYTFKKQEPTVNLVQINDPTFRFVCDKWSSLT